MSTTSSVTSLAACNCIPGNEIELLNHICVLVLSRGNSPPFDATSIQEQNIIEICIWLGQTHPKGVLWYSVVESVILLQSVEEMLVVAHGVFKAMALHEELIRLRTSPPSATHVRAFMAARDEELSDAQPSTCDRGEKPLPSPNDPHLGGRTPHQLQVNLGDLAEAELWQLMGDLQQEVTLRELNAPQGPTANPLGKFQWETGTPMWMTRRSPF